MSRGIFEGRRVVVMGLGRFGGGADVARFAARSGGDVLVTDKASAEALSDSVAQLREFGNISYRLGGHDAEDFRGADVVVVNPAVGGENEYVRIAREAGAEVTNQINLFFRYCPCRIVGITGSNGKSTTTALTGHVLGSGVGKAGFGYGKVWVGGNIGKRPLLEILDEIGGDDIAVLELSSFQTEGLGEVGFGPFVGLLTNLTPNHLDRHGTFEEYGRCKKVMFDLQHGFGGEKAVSIFNGEDEVGRRWYEEFSRGGGRICAKYSAEDVSEGLKRCFKLPGRANLSNLGAAMVVGRVFGVREEWVAEKLGEFKGLPHRLEFVAEKGGARWYNDSIATTPESVMVALEAFDCGKVIIAGGYDKGVDFDDLGRAIAARAKGVVLIGVTAEKIGAAIGKYDGGGVCVEFAGSLGEAVEKAGRIAERGDVVLLSPACASYDMFRNFEHRGEEFVRLVCELAD